MTGTGIGAGRLGPPGAALLVVSLALGIGARLLLSPAESPAAWTGFHTLLVDSGVAEPDVLARLGAAGITEVLSESTEPVLLSDWGGLETMSLAEARARLMPGDPRLDSYLSRLGLWFKARSGASEYRAYYIKGGAWLATGAGMERRIGSALRGLEGRYLLPDSHARFAADPAIACLALAALLLSCAAGPLAGARSGRRPRSVLRAPTFRALDRIALRLAIALPWALLALAGGGRAVPAALWGIAAVEAADVLDLPLEELRTRGSLAPALKLLALQKLPAPALPIMALLALAILPESLPSTALALLASVLGALGYALAVAPRSARPRFTPLPIARPSSSWAGPLSLGGGIRTVLALCVGLAWLVVGFSPRSVEPSAEFRIVRPLPERGPGGRSLGLAEARSRAAVEVSGDLLPGLASFLVHKAGQEAVPYERIGEVRADAFAPASLPLPSGTPPAEGADRGLDFTDAWVRASLASLPQLSLESMLLRQGTGTLAKVEAGAPSGAGGPLAPIDSLLYIILLVPPVGRLLLGLPRPRARPGAS